MSPQSEKNPREVRGREIAQTEGQISRVIDYYYSVRSQRESHKNYFVERKEFGWECTCPDFVYRRVKCKHIFGILFSLELRKVVEVAKIEPITSVVCIFCKSSNITKFGKRKNKYGDLQIYLCKNCTRTFSFNIGFERMKHDPKGITTALQLYFSGESLRNVQKSLRLLGVQVCHRTVYNWIQKYTELMNKYLDQITPNVSDTWRADEIYVKVKGNPKYLFAMMDDETRFWIAQEVADTKERHDARNLFAMAKDRAGKRPETIITDGLGSYHKAYQKKFFAHRTKHTRHIREIRIDGKIHNNKMERMNGEIRDREKTMRGLKIVDTPVLKGYQLFHNFIRPHEALEGKTPADKAGIEVLGENKWRTLIENASQSEKAN